MSSQQTPEQQQAHLQAQFQVHIRNLISAVLLAQTRGVYKMEESERIAPAVRGVLEQFPNQDQLNELRGNVVNAPKQ
jgi:hypothetical protein